MIDIRKTTTGLTAACLGILCSAAIALPAQALPYTHSEQEADAGLGVVHIAVTLDTTAIDNAKKAVWLPINHESATVSAVMNEFLNASEDKVDRFAHADYDLQSLAEYLEGKTVSVAVYKAGAQAPGAAGTYTSETIGDATFAGLETGDGVYITVSE